MIEKLVLGDTQWRIQRGGGPGTGPPLWSRLPPPPHCGPDCLLLPIAVQAHAPSIAVPYIAIPVHGSFLLRFPGSGAPAYSHLLCIPGQLQRARARVMLKYCCFRQRSSVDLVYSISYCIEQSFKQHKHNDSPWICHCICKGQDPRTGSRAWPGSRVLQDLSGDWTSRPDESDYIWVCFLYIIIILTLRCFLGKLLNFNAWYA